MAHRDSDGSDGIDADAGISRRTVKRDLDDQMPPAWRVRVHQFHDDGEARVRAICRYPDSALITVAPAHDGGYKTSIKAPDDRHARLALTLSTGMLTRSTAPSTWQ